MEMEVRVELAADGRRVSVDEARNRGLRAVGKRLAFELRNGRKLASLSTLERRALLAFEEPR